MFHYFLLGFLTFTCASNFIDIIFLSIKVRSLEEEVKQIKYIEVERK